MAEDSFILLNLREKQSKHLANVISNETSRQILDFLAGTKHSTETEIATKMGIPLSTVHYNLKALKEAKLVVTDEFHYSDKGKEVPHYKLAKKFIIIAPRDDEGILEKLKKFFPVTVFAAGVSAALYFIQKIYFAPTILFNSASTSTDALPQESMRIASKIAAEPTVAHDVLTQTLPAAYDSVAGASSVMVEGVQALAQNVSENLSVAVFQAPASIAQVSVQQAPIALWFLAGSLFVILSMAIWEVVRRKNK